MTARAGRVLGPTGRISRPLPLAPRPVRRLLVQLRLTLVPPPGSPDRLLRAALLAVLLGLAVGLLVGVRLVLAAPVGTPPAPVERSPVSREAP